MGSWRRGACAVFGLVLVGAAGCTKDEAGPASPPTTVATSIQSVSAAPSGSTSPGLSASSAAPQGDRLLKLATAQLVGSQRAFTDILKSGGLESEQTPTTLQPYLMGESLFEYAKVARNFKENQALLLAGSIEVWDVKVVSTAPGAVITVSACLDGSSLRTQFGADKKKGVGEPSRTRASFKYDGKLLKVYESDDVVDKTCVAS